MKMGLSYREIKERDEEIYNLKLQEHWSDDELAKHFKLTVNRVRQILTIYKTKGVSDANE